MNMNISDELKGKTVVEQEAWLLSVMDSKVLPLDDMFAVIGLLRDAGAYDRARSSIDLLQDALVAAKDGEGTLRLLLLCSSWGQSDESFKKKCLDALNTVFDNRLGQAFIKACFDARLPIDESLRRVLVLSSLSVGRFCYDKTWGFGVVKRLDDFYSKITIDFDRKPGHQMIFSYAAEALQLVGADHLLVMKHTDPDGMTELAKKDPSEVVKIALKSYGEMSAVILQEKIVDDIIKEADWKKFWEAARKGLRRDPLVELPAKRTVPIKLLSEEKEYGEKWFASLAQERDPDVILREIEDLEKESGIKTYCKEYLTVLSDRLNFSIIAGRWKRPDIVARGFMAVSRLGLEGVVSDADNKELLSTGRFLTVASSLPARYLSVFMDYLNDQGQDEAVALLLSVLPEMPLSILTESLRRLDAVGKNDDVLARFSPLLSSRRAGVEILCWIAKNNLGQCNKWFNAGATEFLTQAVDILSVNASGERLKTRNQLRGYFTKNGWIDGLLDEMSSVQREELVRRISVSNAWETSSQRSLLAKIIRLFPELGSVLSSDAEKRQADVQSPLITSWRSYGERQEQYKKLIDVEIPLNIKDIAVARSYGDLRENFEYQSAKDQQRLLTRRKADMEIDLDTVHGSDFEGFSNDVVGMGTMVEFVRANGSTEQYCVLGEWDRDEKLRVVSSGSRIAQLLNGHKEGDEVMLPSTTSVSDELESCRIVSIKGLSDDLKVWVKGVVPAESLK